MPVKQLDCAKNFSEYLETSQQLCLNSWTSGRLDGQHANSSISPKTPTASKTPSLPDGHMAEACLVLFLSGRFLCFLCKDCGWLKEVVRMIEAFCFKNWKQTSREPFGREKWLRVYLRNFQWFKRFLALDHFGSNSDQRHISYLDGECWCGWSLLKGSPRKK